MKYHGIVTSTLDIVGTIAEVFTWIGLVLGGLCFLSLLIARTIGGRWVETDAVAISESGNTRLRWMSPSGLHEQLLGASEHDPAGAESHRVFYSERNPNKIRFDPTGHGERTLRLLSLLLLGLGAAALIASIALIFVPE